MRLLDLTLSTPADNLALDEALLDDAEHTHPSDLQVLRFWESPTHFVVLGAGSKPELDVNLDACNRLSIPVLRRCSGGGTIVQGPGCLSYALILAKSRAPRLNSIHGTNEYVLEKICAALRTFAPDIHFAGTSDLAIGDRKVSGNAQRRKKHFILFHGTILYAFDLALISSLLKHPPKEPDYRANRPHVDFIANVPASASDLKIAIQLSLKD